MITFGVATMNKICDIVAAHMGRNSADIMAAFNEFDGTKFKMSFNVEMNHNPKDASNAVSVEIKFREKPDRKQTTDAVVNDYQMELFMKPETVDMGDLDEKEEDISLRFGGRDVTINPQGVAIDNETGEIVADETDLEKVERMSREADSRRLSGYTPSDEGEPD